MADYLQHARRHLRGGTDPLEIDVVEWMAVSITITADLASSGSSSNIDLNPATASWDTSDSLGTPASSAIFGLADGGGGFNSIQIKEAGFYLFFLEALMTQSTTPGAGTVGQIGLTGNNYQVSGGDIAPWLASLAGVYSCNPSRVAFSSLPASYFSFPLYKTVTLGQNSGNTVTNSYSVDVLALKLKTAGSLLL